MSRKLRVLVFEDDAIIRHIIERILKIRGYEVFAYDNPTKCPLNDVKDCGCSSKSNCADMIISDIKMPHVDGLSFIQNMLEKGCNIHPENICVISGFWSKECLRTATLLGVKQIYKPFTMDYLNNWLDEREKGINFDKELIDIVKIQEKIS